MNRFAKYAWAVLGYNLAVILWGAMVRATGSGAGCGGHWPLCNGVAIPQSPQVETIIEYSHRLTSGLSVILIVILLIWAFRAYPRRHPARLGAVLSLVFIFTEALIGAALVLFQWVAENVSVGRAVSVSIHLVNTFLLLAALTLTAWWAGAPSLRRRSDRLDLPGLIFGLGGVVLVGITGTITALGDTLFPAGSLAEGFSQDVSPTANFLIRLRVWHPLIAILVGLYLISLVARLREQSSGSLVKRLATVAGGLVAAQIAAGAVNVLLLAPVWMQLVHLLLADAVWVSLVLLSAATLNLGMEIPGS